MRSTLLLGALLGLVSAGCGGAPYEVAPVSGKVRLNGQPLAKAHVSFRPVADGKKLDPGPGSVGLTNEQGEFTLRLIDPEIAGAVVGKHQVAVMLPDEELANSGSSSTDDAGGPANKVYRMPQRYRDGSALSFEVPREGTARADFELSIP